MSQAMRNWVISLAGLAGFLLAAWFGIRYLLPALLPFVLAVLLSAAIERPVRWLVKHWRITRGWAAVLILAVIAIVLLLLLTWLASRLVAELNFLYKSWPQVWAGIGQAWNGLNHTLSVVTDKLPPSARDVVNNALDSAGKAMQSLLPSVSATLSAVSTFTAVLADLLLAVLATFFISKDRDRLTESLAALLPPGTRVTLGAARRDVFQSLLGYFEAILILVGLTAVLTTLGLWVIGNNYAVLVGVLTGLADLIPVVGTAAVFLPWIGYTLVFGPARYAIGLALVYVVQLAVRQVMEPKLVGERMGIPPLVVLFSAYVGLKVFGGLGFLWGPILAICIKALVRSGVLPAFGGPDTPHK